MVIVYLKLWIWVNEFIFLFISSDYKKALVRKTNSKAIHHIDIKDFMLDVKLVLNDHILLTLTDYLLKSYDLRTFKRVINSQEYYFNKVG